MAYEQRDNTGSLFKNDRKEKETHPDYTGQAMIDGKQYWISAWLKIKPNGEKFFSFAYKPKVEPPVQKSISQRATETIKRPDPISSGKQNIIPDDDMSDEIPF